MAISETLMGWDHCLVHFSKVWFVFETCVDVLMSQLHNAINTMVGLQLVSQETMTCHGELHSLILVANSIHSFCCPCYLTRLDAFRTTLTWHGHDFINCSPSTSGQIQYYDCTVYHLKPVSALDSCNTILSFCSIASLNSYAYLTFRNTPSVFHFLHSYTKAGDKAHQLISDASLHKHSGTQ